jgi:DNA-binding NarL/FixJ family response regulator
LEPVIPAAPESPAAPETASSVKKTSSEETAELPFTDEEKGRGNGSPQARGTKKQKKNKKANTQAPVVHHEKQGIKMQIAQMAIQGLSPSEIASRLGISSAEVDLALQLINIGSREQ